MDLVRMSVFILFAFLLIVLGAWLFSLRGAGGKTQVVKIGNAVFRVELANSALTRMKGLAGHAPLADDEGMLFIFDSPGNYGFWMKGMTFPIDIIWIRRNKVVGVSENLPVPKNMFDFTTYYPPEPVDKVLEVKAGTFRTQRIVMGDFVILNRER